MLSNSGKLMSDLVAYVDGGSLGNPGPSGIGVVIEGCATGTIRIARLDWPPGQQRRRIRRPAGGPAVRAGAQSQGRCTFIQTPRSIVRQMRGEYACRSPRLYSLHWICRKLTRSLKFSITHVPRERNAEANGLANSAVRGRLKPAPRLSPAPRTT